jgi:hypothetical protein
MEGAGDSSSDSEYDSSSDSYSSSDEEPTKMMKSGSRVKNSKAEANNTTRVMELPATEADFGMQTVRVSYRICASLNDLKKGKVDASLKINEKARNIFDSLEEGRSKNHICSNLKVVEYSHNFPCSLQLDVEGLHGVDSAKSFTQSGARGAFTMRPNADFADETTGVELTAGTSRAHQSPFLQKYTGWNLDNVDRGITFAADGINALVESDHPICEYYNASLKLQGQDEIGEQDLLPGTKMFMCKAKDVKDCLNSLKKGMSENLNISDLHNVSFNLRRAYGEPSDDGTIAWDADEDLFDNLADPTNARAREAVENKKRTLYLTASFKMKSLDG